MPTIRPQKPVPPLSLLTARIDGDGIYLPAKTSHNTTIEGRKIQMRGGRAGIINDDAAPGQNGRLALRNILVKAGRGASSITKWFIRIYLDRLDAGENPDALVLEILNVRGEDPTLPDDGITLLMEHLFYSGYGKGRHRIEGLSGRNINAQLAQFRHTLNRADPKWHDERTVEFLRTHGKEVGRRKGIGRAGFAMSLKDAGPKSDFDIRDTFLETIEQTAVAVRSDGTKADSFGAICVEYCRHLLLQNGYVNFKNPRGHAVQLYDFARKDPARTGPEEIEHLDYVYGSGNGIAVRIDATTRGINIQRCEGSGTISVYKLYSDGVYRVARRPRLEQGFSYTKRKGLL
jgi:hypothetical protein